ncbi:SLAM family member 5-like [Nyctibius grandis]|uniref:SLAM family member 5-like n=1 Tax=Nyctibius grandis TaxID=48427 RepID=UPI0035BBD82A
MGMALGHPCPHVPWLLAPLLVVAGTTAAQPQRVNGILGGSVLLSPALPPNKTVKEIEWSFSAGAGATIQVAEFGPSGFERPDPQDRFKERLEMFNATALRIRALERGDSGVYGARIKLHPALVEDRSFNLSVYGPVPVPEIQHQQLSLGTQGCNVTLRCWVPAGSDAEAAWQLSSSLGTTWGQLCEDSRTLCLAVPASAFNTTYTCVARNPTQERSTSVRLDTLCQQQDTRGWRRWHVWPVLLAVSAGALLGIGWLWRKKRRKKAGEGAALACPSSEDAPPEQPYTEIRRRNPPEADERQRDHPTTIYSEVQAGAGSWAQPLA